MKILVIRFKFIGDALLSSTLCSSLRKSFPDAQIDFMVYANAAPLFAQSSVIDNTLALSVEERKPLAYLKRIRRLRRTNYDIIIDATSTNKSELICWFTRRAKYRIGRYKKGRGWFYTHRVKKFAGDKVQQRLAMLQPLIDEGFNIIRDEQIRVELSPTEVSQAADKFMQAGLDPTQPIFAFAVSSKLDYRLWNSAYMREVAWHCMRVHHAQILLLPGMPHEQAYIDQFKLDMDNHDQVFNNVVAEGLRDVCAILSQCDLYVGNEGGPRHFAEAVNVPSVSVFSPSAELDEWLPGKRSNHQAVDWRSVTNLPKEPDFEFGDATYYELYNSIKPKHVIELVDRVVTQHL